MDRELAEALVAKLETAGAIDSKGALSYSCAEDREVITKIIVELEPSIAHSRAYVERITASVIRASYLNLYKVLGDNLDETTYLSIVRNKILVDVQGKDVLMQIFSSCVLIKTGQVEGPFLEFIQRVCAKKKGNEGGDSCHGENDGSVTECDAADEVYLKPGCGGFGIRNFLTLFLSIEVSKSLAEKAAAEALADPVLRDKGIALAERKITILTEQLEESNPILSMITDCMTAEGAATDGGKVEEAKAWALKKVSANQALKVCSMKYNAMMVALQDEDR